MLDFDADLHRIGRYPADQPTWQAVHRVHATTIPFENLDCHRGLPISAEQADIERKLVASRRGGYCFEHRVDSRKTSETDPLCFGERGHYRPRLAGERAKMLPRGRSHTEIATGWTINPADSGQDRRAGKPVNAPSCSVKDDIFQFNQSFDSIPSL
jgi:hypothetical protein